MEITLLVKSFLGLIAILGILVFFLLYMPKKNNAIIKAKQKHRAPKTEHPNLQELLEIIKNKKSTTKELAFAVDTVLKYYSSIHPKLGIRSHPDFNIYGEMLLRICRHPNTSKDIILKFNRELEKKNPEYKREINDFVTKGLDSRGF
ncbi:hypothetical protein JHD46_03175 [Sulfurimonas sp. SAG-AH-194-C20]|nr:hypothetical protein [Sulfurimonas sp. SAG-AH-194-C20]MDF1878637.1 hypothetical protein [Sulfurimonas sp. SAG-AH-194-C20]